MASRNRNFATVIYPSKEFLDKYGLASSFDGRSGYGDAPDDFIDILTSYHVPMFLSPCHDSDLNPERLDNGDLECKKPHFHLLIMFEGVKTLDQAQVIIDSVHGVGIEVVSSIRGYARYLCHLDNPEKHQYDTENVRCFGGADYISTIGLASDRHQALTEMEEFCTQYNVISYYALTKYAALHRPDWLRVLHDSGTIHMSAFLKSKQWSDEFGASSIVDPVTGEIII